MIDKPPSFQGLNIRIPFIIPIKWRGLINHGSTLDLMVAVAEVHHSRQLERFRLVAKPGLRFLIGIGS